MAKRCNAIKNDPRMITEAIGELSRFALLQLCGPADSGLKTAEIRERVIGLWESGLLSEEKVVAAWLADETPRAIEPLLVAVYGTENVDRRLWRAMTLAYERGRRDNLDLI